MVTAISKANFETALGTCYDFIVATDWKNARIYATAAEAQLAGLEQRAGENGSYFELRNNLKSLMDQIDEAEANVSRGNDKNRMMTPRTGYSR